MECTYLNVVIEIIWLFDYMYTIYGMKVKKKSSHCSIKMVTYLIYAFHIIIIISIKKMEI